MALREIGSVADQDKTLIRMPSEPPRRKTHADQLAFPVARRHNHDQALDFAPVHSLQRLGECVEVRREPVLAKRPKRKRNQVASCVSPQALGDSPASLRSREQPRARLGRQRCGPAA